MSKKNYFDKKGKFLPANLATEASVDVGVGPEGTFWSYDNGLWSSDPDVVQARCVYALGNEYARTRASNVADIVRLRKTTPRIPSAPEGVNKWYPYVNLLNGMYNWQDDTYEAHDPGYGSTIQLNVEYDMAAECPRFDAWVRDILDDDLHELFWEVLGYCLMTGNPKQTAVLLFGPGGTGKSTFLRVLEYILDRRNIATESLKSLTENRFAVANLFGKIANIQGDIDSAYMKDSSIFKALTGGDTLMAEYKNKTAFPFEPFAVPIFSANKVWRSSDDTGGYFRRWVILPFVRQVDRTKPFDEEDLFAEGSGIFNKAMRALRGMYDQTIPKEVGPGIVIEEPHREFSVQGSAREAFEKFTQDSDPLRMWLADDERLTVDAGNEALRTPRTQVFATYQNWCYANGLAPKTAPEFYKSMAALRFTLRKSGNERFILGIGTSSVQAEAFA